LLYPRERSTSLEAGSQHLTVDDHVADEGVVSGDSARLLRLGLPTKVVEDRGTDAAFAGRLGGDIGAKDGQERGQCLTFPPVDLITSLAVDRDGADLGVEVSRFPGDRANPGGGQPGDEGGDLTDRNALRLPCLGVGQRRVKRDRRGESQSLAGFHLRPSEPKLAATDHDPAIEGLSGLNQGSVPVLTGSAAGEASGSVVQEVSGVEGVGAGGFDGHGSLSCVRWCLSRTPVYIARSVPDVGVA